jgi:hypothetical protein
MLRNISRGASIVLVLFVSAACGEEETGPQPLPQVESIDAYIEAMNLLDNTRDATLSTEDAPASSGGPAVTVGANRAIVMGGSQQASLSAAGDFTAVIVSIDGATGHYRLELPAETPVQEIVLTYVELVPATNFDLRFQVVAADGSVSDVEMLNVDRVRVGIGLVQVTVSWNTSADIDLHLVDPSGEEIFLDHSSGGDLDTLPLGPGALSGNTANPESASGGKLDHISNLNCVDESRNENIFWERGALTGTYTIRLALISTCSAAETDYVVTVRIDRRRTIQFRGTISGPPTGGAQGAGIEVGEFQF